MIRGALYPYFMPGQVLVPESDAAPTGRRRVGMSYTVPPPVRSGSGGFGLMSFSLFSSDPEPSTTSISGRRVIEVGLTHAPLKGTVITTTPANLLNGPRTDIKDFTVEKLDAGTY